MLSRTEALELMESKISNINLRRHMLATEAIMRELGRVLNQDEELWAIAGLLHDIDLEAVEGDPDRHAIEAVKWLDGKLPDDALAAIKSHNGEQLGIERSGVFDHALASAESLTGLIVASVLVLPTKRIEDLKVKSVRKRFKEPRFAAGANREIIRECEKLGIELDQFMEIGVEAMRKIGPELGL